MDGHRKAWILLATVAGALSAPIGCGPPVDDFSPIAAPTNAEVDAWDVRDYMAESDIAQFRRLARGNGLHAEQYWLVQSHMGAGWIARGCLLTPEGVVGVAGEVVEPGEWRFRFSPPTKRPQAMARAVELLRQTTVFPRALPEYDYDATLGTIHVFDCGIHRLWPFRLKTEALALIASGGIARFDATGRLLNGVWTPWDEDWLDEYGPLLIWLLASHRFVDELCDQGPSDSVR